jgi:hypothetical protein
MKNSRQMKQRMCLWMALFLSFLLSGCGTLSPFVMSGQAREDYLKSIKPYLQKWDKAGMTIEGRREDSKECGGSGDSSDRTGIGPTRIKAAHRPGETEGETYTRLFHDWERCLIKKSYRFTDKCYDNKISWASPACAGRVLDPHPASLGDGRRRRLDLDVICGRTNERCKIKENADGTPIFDANGKTQLAYNADGMAQFDSEIAKMSLDTLAKFLGYR